MVASGLPVGKKAEEEKEFIERVFAAFARGREEIQLLRNHLVKVKERHNPSSQQQLKSA
jgi:hypothetical protein